MSRLPDRSLRKWLRPGLGVKRWFVLMFIGTGLMGLGVAFLLRELYVTATLPDAFYYLTLQFLPYAVRGGILMALALLCVSVGVWKFTTHVVASVRGTTETDESLVDLLHRHRMSGRGPRIVCLGGGTGLSVLLRGLKEYTDNLTAIVTVADDGGSSGRLRRELG